MSRRGRMMLLAIAMLTLTACSTSTSERSGSSSEQPSETQLVPTAPGSTASLVPSSTHVRSSARSVTATPTALSSASGSYSMPIFDACGKSFHGMVYTLHDLPKEIQNPSIGFDIVVSNDCQHGGTVAVTPSSAAKVTAVATATDGHLLVAHIDSVNGKNASLSIRENPESQPVNVKIIWGA